MPTLVHDHSPFDQRHYLVEKDIALACEVWPRALKDLPGSLFRGTVRRTLKGRRAFIDLGLDNPGFLEPKHTPDGTLPTEGTTLVARVLRSGWGNKGPKLSTQSIAKELGSAHTAGAPARIDAASEHPYAWPDPSAVLDVDHATPAPITSSLPDPATDLRKRRVWTRSGMNVVVETTETATTVDINSAKATSLSDEAAAREAMDAALQALALRNLAGMVLIDLPRSGSSKARARWAEQACANAALPYTFHGLSNLGLVELSRTRFTPSLYELWRSETFRGEIEMGSAWRAWKRRSARQDVPAQLRLRPDLVTAFLERAPDAEPFVLPAETSALKGNPYLL